MPAGTTERAVRNESIPDIVRPEASPASPAAVEDCLAIFSRWDFVPLSTSARSSSSDGGAVVDDEPPPFGSFDPPSR
jgi:hypothetical protein